MKNVILFIFSFAYTIALGQIGIGTREPRGVLDLESTTGGIVPPSLTTVQRDALTIEMRPKSTIIFNTDENVLQINTGTDETPIWSTFYFPSQNSGSETKKILYTGTTPDNTKSVTVGKFKFRIFIDPDNKLTYPQFGLVSDPETSIAVSYHVGQYFDISKAASGGYQYVNTSTTFTSSNYSVFVNIIPTDKGGPTMSNLERNEMWLAYPGEDLIYHVQFLVIGSSTSGSINTYGILVNKY